jgi:hypothetical protein
MRTPATDLDAYSDPLRYGFSALIPFAKYPMEKGLGFNTYTGKDFYSDLPWYNPQNSAESNLVIGGTGRDVGTLSDVYEDRNAGKQGVKYLSGIGQAKTETKKKNDTDIRDAYMKYTGRPNDFTYEQRLQFALWKVLNIILRTQPFHVLFPHLRDVVPRHRRTSERRWIDMPALKLLKLTRYARLSACPVVSLH